MVGKSINGKNRFKGLIGRLDKRKRYSPFKGSEIQDEQYEVNEKMGSVHKALDFSNRFLGMNLMMKMNGKINEISNYMTVDDGKVYK